MATSAGAEGVPGLTDGEQLLIRDAPGHFADAVVKVIKNKIAAEIGSAGSRICLPSL